METNKFLRKWNVTNISSENAAKTEIERVTHLDDIRAHSVSISDFVHVAFQIHIEEFENEV